MSMEWTRDQQEVIDVRDCNILVSAAAGSGKTAVLVERIIQMLLDEKHPLDIDHLLIVTFTNAAAAEMRERIGLALTKALTADPDNGHLQRQTTLIHNAQINTIDGFCSFVVRNYFHKIDLDPSFRIGDEGELKLLRADTLERLLEARYQEADEEFITFVETFSTGKSDAVLGDRIEMLYNAAESHPYPEQWLEQCMQEGEEWRTYLWQDVGQQLSEAAELVEENRRLCGMQGGPAQYLSMVEEDGVLVDLIQKTDKTIDAFAKMMGTISFSRLSNKKTDGEDETLKTRVKKNRDEMKDILKKLTGEYFYADGITLERYREGSMGPVQTLVRLTQSFAEEYSRAKQDRNIIDFSDLEHFALQILVQEDLPTEAARELAAGYDAIFIDEYQDSNFIQEELMRAVSRIPQGQYNIFMVGDVKQSIYRFRQARPELFMQKYETYEKSAGNERRIDLGYNFRSRHQILDITNYIFRQIMIRPVGGVAYDDDAALYPGADFPKNEEENFYNPEVLLIDSKVDNLSEDVSSESAPQLEARVIAQRIREIVGHELVYDRDIGTYRQAKYRDIVILLRTVAGWADAMSAVLTQQGIPAYATTKTGYFSAQEISMMLDLLRVCDNPMQDIPMASVLHSPFVGCTAQELAQIRAAGKNAPLYETIRSPQLFTGQLRGRIEGLLDLTDDVRERMSYTPLNELIWYIALKSGYADYVAVMPQGRQRIANLRMLVEKAVDFETTSYGGLFQFIRYIEHLQKYEVDFGEVNVVGELDDTVRIMSIHKSKGLEFPIVFVAGMGKRFNEQDLRQMIVLHPELGIGADYIDTKERVKAPTLKKKVIQSRSRLENIGEEMRVLYVAMTRAKEKLIMTGVLDKAGEKFEMAERFAMRSETALPYTTVASAHSYMDWLVPALARRDQCETKIGVKVITPSELVADEVRHRVDLAAVRERLENWDGTHVYDETVRSALEERFDWRYPYDDLGDIPIKVTVSDLKHHRFEEEMPEAERIYTGDHEEHLIPDFMRVDEEEQATGAGRGTLYHEVMEKLDFEAALAAASAGEVPTGTYDPAVDSHDILLFAGTELAERMAAAQRAGRLYREQPFVIGVPASSIRSDWDDAETVLVQGIVDAYFETDDGLVIVDYKTDRIGDGGGSELVEKYQVQLDYYAKALAKLTGIPVSEKLIYSFTLHEVIRLPD